MMATAVIFDEMTTPLGVDDDITHWYCEYCYPDADVAFCSIDISDSPIVGDERSTDCVVCVDLDFCPICDPE